MTDARPPWHALPLAQVLAELRAPSIGLTTADATRRLARSGPNRVAAIPPVSAWRMLARQLASVVVALLVVAAALAVVIGEAADAAAIVAVLALNLAIGFATEWRARRSLEGLRALDVSRATVLRDGRTVDLDAARVVPGDVVVLDAGMAVPADARLLAASELRVVESALTGEARTVAKQASAVVPADAPLAERTTMVYKATLVAAGSARAVVVATGAHTEVGHVGALVAGVADEATPLERRLDALGRRLAVVAVAVAALVAAMNLFLGMPLGRVLETGIAVAIAAIPEGLPAVVTITMAVGVRRMARRRALVRRLPTVETLGAATVVCTDKTGTLTLGEMTVATVWLPAGVGRSIAVRGVGHVPEGAFALDGVVVAPEAVAGLTPALTAAALANRATLSCDASGEWSVRGDPTEWALLVAARKAGIDRAAQVAEWPEIGEIPFTSERMWMATIHRTPDEGTMAFAKGAPTRILDRCARVSTAAGARPLDAAARATILAANDALAAGGLRVLALAAGPVRDAEEASCDGLTLLGLVGLTDPPAPGVLETIASLRAAGIRTVMLTGDQRPTAEAIAAALGIGGPGAPTLDGQTLDRLTDAALDEAAAHVSTFARVSPAAKLRIIDALRRRGEVVAMLGDGVNDAPALRRADVGIAMGRRGTDLAKDAAGIVLADDRFATVGAAVEEGRVVYDNIRRFVFYLLSCNLAEILVLLAAGLAGLPSPLSPLQLLWLNLLTDTLPALSLAFEPAERDAMRRPPRDPATPLLSRRMLAVAGAYALTIGTASFAALLYGRAGEASAGALARAGTMTFMTLALTQVAHLANARRLDGAARYRPANRYAAGAAAVTVALQLLAGLAPPLARVLDVTPLGLRDWSVVGLLSLAPLALGPVVRRIGRGGGSRQRAVGDAPGPRGERALERGVVPVDVGVEVHDPVVPRHHRGVEHEDA